MSRLLKERLKWGTVAAMGLALSLYPPLKNNAPSPTGEMHNKTEAVMGGEEKKSLTRAIEFLFSPNLEEYFCREKKANYPQTFYLSSKSFYGITGYLYIPNQIIRWLSGFRGTSRNPWISV